MDMIAYPVDQNRHASDLPDDTTQVREEPRSELRWHGWTTFLGAEDNVIQELGIGPGHAE